MNRELSSLRPTENSLSPAERYREAVREGEQLLVQLSCSDALKEKLLELLRSKETLPADDVRIQRIGEDIKDEFSVYGELKQALEQLKAYAEILNVDAVQVACDASETANRADDTREIRRRVERAVAEGKDVVDAIIVETVPGEALQKAVHDAITGDLLAEQTIHDKIAAVPASYDVFQRAVATFERFGCIDEAAELRTVIGSDPRRSFEKTGDDMPDNKATRKMAA